MRRRGLATDPVQDGALNVPVRRILDGVLIIALLVRKGLIPANSNPGVWICGVGLEMVLPVVVGVYVDRHEGDAGVLSVEEGRLALGGMAKHMGVHVGRSWLWLRNDFVATLALFGCDEVR